MNRQILNDTDLDAVSGGSFSVRANFSRNPVSSSEINMIGLQSLVSQRATALQLTTGMMNSVNDGTKSVAGNIGD